MKQDTMTSIEFPHVLGASCEDGAVIQALGVALEICDRKSPLVILLTRCTLSTIVLLQVPFKPELSPTLGTSMWERLRDTSRHDAARANGA